MFVIVTYDVNVRRDSKLLKICRKYLQHSQKSVFEGYITEAKLNLLKEEIKKVIDPDVDSIQIYRFNTTKYSSKDVLGTYTESSNIL